MMAQSLWDAAKAVLRWKFKEIKSYLKKQKKKSQIDNLTLHLKQLEKEEQKTQSQQKKMNHKDQIRNKLKRNEGNDSKDQKN